MTARETSRESYKKLTDLPEKQLEVYNALKELEPCSDRDIEKHIGMQMGAINARRGELMKYGFVVAHGRKYDKETKRNVITWVTADPMAQRQVEKVVGKLPKSTEHTQEIKSVNKFTLRLKNGKLFTISEAMKEEIEASIKTQRGTIEIAGHVFALSNIVLPIQPQEVDAELEVVKTEKTREIILVEKDGAWVETSDFTSALRKAQTPFRTRKIGLESGRTHSDWLTHFPDGYETLRDMKGND